MFYSESLLARNGPLARVWLAANLERKLTKQNVLQSNIDDNVKDIIGTGKAPIALRLSGQLLLGVARIYHKKAKYLVDDCADAYSRLKLTFRGANVDLPANQQINANPAALQLPDLITDEQDLLAGLPNPDDLFRDTANLGLGDDSGLFADSQILPDAQATPRSTRHSRPAARLEEDDLGLDFGDEPSIEMGRRAESARPDQPSALEDDLGIDFGFDDTTGVLGDTHMGGMNDGPTTAKAVGTPSARHNKEPGSAFRDGTAVEEIDETEVQAAQRVKRRKVLQQDAATTLGTSVIKQQQEDRSAITRQPDMLPRDPVLLQLMQMQKSGAFVSSLLGDGTMAGWAPELRGILSIELVTKVGDRKRKRDSGIADMETSSDRAASSPRLDVSLEDQGYGGDPALDDWGRDLTVNDDLLPGDDSIADALAGDSNLGPHEAAFDVTEAPLLHPSQTGPVSLGTKTAVAALRRHLAPGHKGHEPPTPSSRTRAEASFTELCPHDKANRNDATKMFFELLVLGTKDAVKIEQDRNKGLHGEIRIRGKRGLWGNWAEMGDALDAPGHSETVAA